MTDNREPQVCGSIHSDPPFPPVDHAGCILSYGHSGPHEFIEANGEHWLWEADMECDCEHCMRCEGDYCTVYWRKPRARAAASGAAQGDDHADT